MWPHLNAAVSPRADSSFRPNTRGTVRSRYSLARRGRARASRRNLAMHSCRLRFAGLAILLALTVSFTATAGGQAPPPAAAAAADTDIFAGLSFRNIGPATMGGRVDDVAVLDSNPAVFYVGTATGGLWKTTNSGTTWQVLFDDLDDAVSIGDVAIAPNDANLVWVGHGRKQQSPERLMGQRRLQVYRRWADLEAHGPARFQAHRSHHRRSGGSRRRLCRGARQSLGIRERSAAYSSPPTAGSRGPTCFSSTTTPAPPSSSRIRRTTRCCMRPRISAGVRPGVSTAAGRAAASTRAATAVAPGRS